MTHNAVYSIFKAQLPVYQEATDTWFANGRNSIRIRTHTKHEFVFTCESEDDWKFETVKFYLNKMKGDKK